MVSATATPPTMAKRKGKKTTINATNIATENDIGNATDNEIITTTTTTVMNEMQDELEKLKSRVEELQEKLWDQTEINSELKRTRDVLSEEIMDLTKALFEEANGMVAAEAMARAKLETSRKLLERELEVTKEHLRLEKQQLYELRDKFGTNNTSNVKVIDESKIDKGDLSILLKEFNHQYFNTLLPKRRFDSRPKNEGPSHLMWEAISSKVDPTDFKDFTKFVDKCTGIGCEEVLALPYVKKICESDVLSCLAFDFKPRPFVKKLAMAMLKNTCSIEKIKTDDSSSYSSSSSSTNTSNTNSISKGIPASHPDSPKNEDKVSSAEGRLRGIVSHFTSSVSSLPDVLLNHHHQSNSLNTTSTETAKFCALCGKTCPPTLLEYRMRLTDEESWILIDESCRERVVAGGHFFTFLRHLCAGIYSNRPILDLYFDMLHFRRCMFYTRMGLSAGMFYIQSDYERFLEIVDEQRYYKDDEVLEEIIEAMTIDEDIVL